jgi:hypothetical protein
LAISVARIGASRFRKILRTEVFNVVSLAPPTSKINDGAKAISSAIGKWLRPGLIIVNEQIFGG